MTSPPPSVAELRAILGGIDIYLFDQLMKGRIQPGMKILDAGCGHGRNVAYLMRAGLDVWAVDQSEPAVSSVRALASNVARALPHDRFRVQDLRRLDFDDDVFDVVISNAVLHFVANHDEFDVMLSELWRVLRRGGMLFVRLASMIGRTFEVAGLGQGRYRLPDGSTRYLVDAERLTRATRRLGGIWLEPLKTTVVHEQRCMTTWCLGKPHG